ncbi:hypothetical protein [Streptomyces marianii]|uniref:Uncharacterized protein n=1 Tax=Streptomyces marianii TaxID=1817406 RepID=A0A5R9DUA0_9ACTN|nr:hypothetical protein [Streptomyces marianii]TLQ39344.1 hypothetical protein FEF34_38845 [Streptomyces marianii]
MKTLPPLLRVGRFLEISRRLLATVHLALLAVAEYAVLLRPVGPGQYGMEGPGTSFRNDGTVRVPEALAVLHAHTPAGESA